jgi:hypothetical protein
MFDNFFRKKTERVSPENKSKEFWGSVEIDFSLVKEIFSTYFETNSIDARVLNLSKPKFVYAAGDGNRGTFHPVEGIQINTWGLERDYFNIKMKHPNNDDQEIKEAVLVDTYIHEVIHDLTYIFQHNIHIIGLETQDKHGTLFRGVNEAATELLKQLILERYLKRKGIFVGVEDIAYRDQAVVMNNILYTIDMLLKKDGFKVGVITSMWIQIVRDMFNTRIDFSGSQLSKALMTTFGDGFVADLSQLCDPLNTDTSADEILKNKLLAQLQSFRVKHGLEPLSSVPLAA